jgi:hypothetical protein
VSTEALLRQTIHPPCTEDEILEIAVPADRAELTLGDRLSLRLGLWLLLRAQRRPRRARSLSHEDVMLLRDRRRITEHESITMLAFDLQRHLR